MKFSDLIEKIRDEYAARVHGLFDVIREDLAKVGFVMSAVEDMSTDEYAWAIFVENVGTVKNCGIWITILESMQSDGENEYGINFGILADVGDKRVVDFKPHNYSEGVWVDVREESEVLARWGEIEEFARGYNWGDVFRRGYLPLVDHIKWYVKPDGYVVTTYYADGRESRVYEAGNYARISDAHLPVDHLDALDAVRLANFAEQTAKEMAVEANIPECFVMRDVETENRLRADALQFIWGGKGLSCLRRSRSLHSEEHRSLCLDEIERVKDYDVSILRDYLVTMPVGEMWH